MTRFKAGDVVRLIAKNPPSWWSFDQRYTVREDDNGLYVVDGEGLRGYMVLQRDDYFEIVPSEAANEEEAEDDALDAEDLLDLVVEELRSIASNHVLTASSHAARIARILGYTVSGNSLVEVEWEA
jgi:hypothetical protein